MSQTNSKLRLADLTIGLSYETSGFVVTEAHIVNFAGLSGDFFDLHMDDVYAREQGFPARVAHGFVNGAEKGTSVAEQKVASRLLKMDS